MKMQNEEQKSIIEKLQKNFEKLTYAQQAILKRVQYKESNMFFQDGPKYGSDYNDCHGDYYDADYN